MNKLEVDNLTVQPYYNNELELHIDVYKDEVAYTYLSAKEALLLRDYLSKWIDDLTCPNCESEQIGFDGCCMCTADDGWGEDE